jgi:hypothetical protein
MAHNAGHNPGVHGAVLTEALASRFGVQVQVATDYDLAAGLKVNPRAVRVARNLTSRQRSGEVGWAPYGESVVMPCCRWVAWWKGIPHGGVRGITGMTAWARHP